MVMKKVHILPPGCHPHKKKTGTTKPPSPHPCGAAPAPVDLLAPMRWGGWAGWAQGALPLCSPLSSPSTQTPTCLCRCCWCWGRRCARCHHHPPGQSCFVQGQLGTSPASSPSHAPKCCLPSRRSGRKAGPHQDRAQPQRHPPTSSSSSRHLHLQPQFLHLPHGLPAGPIPHQTSHPTGTDPSLG